MSAPEDEVGRLRLERKVRAREALTPRERAEALAMAMAEFEAWRKKYEDIADNPDIARVIAAMEKVKAEHGWQE